MGKLYDDLECSISKEPLEGWLPLVENLIAELNERFPGWTCQQVKEKFGGLRFYARAPEGVDWREMRPFIDEAEAASFKTCELCGEPGEPRDQPWVKTRCDEHEHTSWWDWKKAKK